MTFEEFLGEMQSLLDRHVVVALNTYEVAGAAGGSANLTQQAAATFAGVLRRGRGDPELDDAPEGTIVFIIGEERPGGYACLYVAPETYVDGYWIEASDPRGRQLVVLMTKSLFASILPFTPPDEG